ncbi:unnamed protein product (plasmid) [Mycetohabitans rhizoxinica HKI 454]|uniref:Uncharacterized protein n=1 Tax=Mycetohabitans rhizoxinica (strain DSM 19002 / CIP 109453 / HKI 454) TaxID=882378 RepID=E5ATK0_MYCRK|nr:unnamed protein product [Mycetohabitans rhizoxinica HKI 454]
MNSGHACGTRPKRQPPVHGINTRRHCIERDRDALVSCRLDDRVGHAQAQVAQRQKQHDEPQTREPRPASEDRSHDELSLN